MSEAVAAKPTAAFDAKWFYREAGPLDAPAVLLLHGFPTSSHMFRNLIPATGQSAPLRRIGTLGLAVAAACAFSLGIAGQVLTFRTRA